MLQAEVITSFFNIQTTTEVCILRLCILSFNHQADILTETFGPSVPLPTKGKEEGMRHSGMYPEGGKILCMQMSIHGKSKEKFRFSQVLHSITSLSALWVGMLEMGTGEIVRVWKEFEPQGNVSTKWRCHLSQSHELGHWFKWGEFFSSSHVQLCGRAARNAWISTFQDPGKIESKQLSAYSHPFCFHWCMLMVHLVWYQRIQTTKESSQTTALSQLLPSYFSCQLLT